MKQINVYYGASHFSYESEIVPNIGDNYCRIPEFSDKKTDHFYVVQRLLYRDNPNLITVTVEPK